MLSICCWVLNLEFLTWGQLIFEIIQCMLRLCVMAQNSSRKMPCFGWWSRVVLIRIHRKERFPTGWKWMLNKFSLNNKERLHFDLIVSGEIVEFLGKINTVWNKFSLLCSNKLVAPWCMLRRQSDSSQRDIQSHWQIQLNLQSHCPQSEFQKAWKESAQSISTKFCRAGFQRMSTYLPLTRREPRCLWHPLKSTGSQGDELWRLARVLGLSSITQISPAI